MDDADRVRVVSLLAKPLGELTVAEALFLAITLEDIDDEEMKALIA